jgi:sporulation integral membrane protein YlbJ
MRRKIAHALAYAAVLALAAGLVFYAKETAAAAVEGLHVCAQILLPSLFPFFVASQLAVRTGLAGAAGRAFRTPMRALFNLPGACAPAFVLGLIGGYPVGAQTAISLYQQGLCSKTETERLLSFCNNSGPAFILGAVGAMVFGATWAGVLLYAAHVLASVLVGVIFRGYRGKPGPAPKAPPSPVTILPRPPFMQAFTAAVRESFGAVLNVCAFVIFFSVGIRLLTLSGILPGLAQLLATLASPMGLDASFAESLLQGVFEVTAGVRGLPRALGLSAKLSAAAWMLGWAGVSVHSQVLNFIGESGLSAGSYIAGKALHGVISAGLAFLGAALLPFDAEVVKTLTGQLERMTALSPAEAAALALTVSALVWGGFWAAGRLGRAGRTGRTGRIGKNSCKARANRL